MAETNPFDAFPDPASPAPIALPEQPASIVSKEVLKENPFTAFPDPASGVPPQKSKYGLAGSEWDKQPTYIKQEWENANPATKFLVTKASNLVVGLQQGLVGLTQLILDRGAEFESQTDPKRAEKLKEMRNNLPNIEDYLLKASAQHPAGFFDELSSKVARGVGAMVPAVATGTAMKAAPTMLGRLAQAPVVGAAQGAMEYLPEGAGEDTRLKNMGVSALFNMVGAGAVEAMHARVSYALKQSDEMFGKADDIARLPDETTQQRMLKEVYSKQQKYAERGFQIEKEQGVPLTAGQISPKASAADVSARTKSLYGDQVQAYEEGQIAKMHDKFGKIVKSLEGTAKTPENVGQHLFTTVKDMRRGLEKPRDFRFKNEANKVQWMTKGEHVVPITNTNSGIRNAIQQADSSVSIANRPAYVAELQDHLAHLEDITGLTRVKVAPTTISNKFIGESELLTANPSLGKMTAKQFSDELVSVTQKINETTGPARSAHIKYKTLLLEAADDAAKNPALSPEVRQGVTKLIEARDRYQKDTNLIKTIIGAPMMKLLKSKDPIVGEKIVQTISKMPPSTTRAFFNELDNINPAAANNFRYTILENAWNKGKTAGEFSPDAVVKALPEGEKFAAMFDNAFKTKAELRNWLELGVRTGLVAPATGPKGGETAQQLARSFGFMSKAALEGDVKKGVLGQLGWIGGLIASAGEGPIVMKFLMTQDGRNALKLADESLKRWHQASRMVGPAATAMMEQAQKDRVLANTNAAAIMFSLKAQEEPTKKETQQ